MKIKDVISPTFRCPGSKVPSTKAMEQLMKENSKKLHIHTQIIELLKKHFDCNYTKVDEWLSVENPSLGGLSPRDCIVIGYEDKLLDFIKTTLDENEPG